VVCYRFLKNNKIQPLIKKVIKIKYQLDGLAGAKN
jgi:hypothetical protein